MNDVLQDPGAVYFAFVAALICFFAALKPNTVAKILSWGRHSGETTELRFMAGSAAFVGILLLGLLAAHFLAG